MDIKKLNPDQQGAYHQLLKLAVQHPIRLFAVFYTLIALLIIATTDIRMQSGYHPLKGDGFYYYSYARSMVLDFDVNLRNEYELHKPEGKRLVHLQEDGSLGTYTIPVPEYPDNYFAVGSAIMWLPAVAVVHGVQMALYAAGITGIEADGFSSSYLSAVGAISCLYAFLGTWLIYLSLRLRYSAEVSLFSCLFIMTATALLNYVVIDPFYSHVSEFFSASLLLALCLTAPSFTHMTVRRAGAIGLAVGLAALVRWQVVLLGLIPFVMWLRDMTVPGQRLSTFYKGSVLLLAAVAVFLPQLFVWNSIYGGFFVIPQGTSFFVPRMMGWAQVLFSNDHGMIFWHPVTGVALAGLLYAVLRNNEHLDQLKLPLITALIIFVMQAVLNGLVSDVNAGHSFGMRRMINTYPVIAWGLAAVLALAIDKWGTSRVFMAWLLASIWNAALLAIWLQGLGGSVFPR